MPAPETKAAVAPGNFPLTIEEFCSRLSLTDRRVALIGGFCHAEKRAGRVRDTADKFDARFKAFAGAPA